MYFENIQFIAAGGTDAFLATTLLRTTFKNCVFGDNASGASAANSGFKASATVAGCTFEDCYLGMTNTATYCLYGIYAGGQFSQNVIKRCQIAGVTAGIYLHTSINAVETIIRDNVIGDFGGGCAKGIDDNSNGLAIIAGNYINAADGIEKTSGGADETIGNIVNEGSADSRVAKSEGNLLVRTS
jgi:nitrous oxidase accessory protein NosD